MYIFNKYSKSVIEDVVFCKRRAIFNRQSTPWKNPGMERWEDSGDVLVQLV